MQVGKIVSPHRNRLHIGLASLLVILFCICCPSRCFAQSNLVERPKQDLLSNIHGDELSASNRELAEQLEILPMLTELYDSHSSATQEQKAILREKIRETLIESYFDAASLQAEALREESALSALKQTLLWRRDRNIELNNATNFIASGTLNTVGSALSFSPRIAPFPSNINQMLSGVVATSLSTYALKQSSGSKTRGQGQPTVIAELFGRPTNERTSYPESVWRFFHGKSLEHPDKTRAQVLEERWISRHFLEPHGTRRESLKLDLVCGVGQTVNSMTINDLSDQITMISDIAAMASLMTHHLRDLLGMIDSDVVL